MPVHSGGVNSYLGYDITDEYKHDHQENEIVKIMPENTETVKKFAPDRKMRQQKKQNDANREKRYENITFRF